MSFVQIMNFRSTRVAEMQALDAQWQRDTGSRHTLRRQVIARDRADEAAITAMFFFDSYESAMANSALPETQANAERYQALMEGPPTFLDLDVVEERGPGGAAAYGFVQVVDARTARLAEVDALAREYEAAIGDRSTIRYTYVTRHRDDPDRHLVLACFDSYDDAMRNSELPETGAFAAKLATLLDGPQTFHDLDVIEDRTL